MLGIEGDRYGKGAKCWSSRILLSGIVQRTVAVDGTRDERD